jgi:hypothetical protein
MNISGETGAICLDRLKSAWNATITIPSIVLMVSSLLTDPNPGIYSISHSFLSINLIGWLHRVTDDPLGANSFIA